MSLFIRATVKSIYEYPPDALANFTEFANNHGYAAEEYTVVTDDGYILSLFRIPKGKKCKGPVRQPPVLLMHGLLQSSDSWLDAGPSAGLAFLISDACYDLWVGNVRGTYYGRRHLRLDPDTDSEFWDFSNDEMGRLDLPATIDFILNTTDSCEIIYIGFSQGGRIFYILCSETEYCDKIRFAITIAPAVRFKYTRSVTVRYFFEFFAIIEPFLRRPHEREILRKGGPVEQLASFICKDPAFADTFCLFFFFAIDSYDPGSFATQTLRVLYGHFPAGTSARNLAFYGQGRLSGRFQKYDYGLAKNSEIYGSVFPPLYNLSRANVPVLLIYGNSDFLVDPRDTKWLATQLPDLVESHEVTRSTWNHFDMSYSQFTVQLIYPKIKQYLEKYSYI
ncbi:unnamed protein product, partial [Iphiclides podalirius]